VTRHHDDRHGQQAITLPFLEQRHAIGIGHPDIEQHQIGNATRAQFTRLLSVFGGGYDMSFIT